MNRKFGGKSSKQGGLQTKEDIEYDDTPTQMCK